MPWPLGLGVMPLHDTLPVNVEDIVHWPIAEHLQRHTHVGGEEIFVISGEFIDEHGRYPAGSLGSAVRTGVEHNPWVEQETVLWVKTRAPRVIRFGGEWVWPL